MEQNLPPPGVEKAAPRKNLTRWARPAGAWRICQVEGHWTMETEAEIVTMARGLARGEVPPLRRVRRAAVRWALTQAGGNFSLAGERLGITRGSVYRHAMD